MLVRKGNVQYQIDKNEKQKYLDNGFDVIDEKGKTLESGKKTLTEENTALKKEVANLKKEIAALKKAQK